MKAARIDNSKRLQRFLGALADCGWHSTLEIIQRAQVVAVSACASECRSQGIKVECERRGSLWFYRLPCMVQRAAA